MTKTRRPLAAPSNTFLPKPSEAETAFLALEPEIEALRESAAAQIDVQVAAAVAHSVAMRDLEPEREAQFERLVAVELYPAGLAERVGQLALATWFSRQRPLGRLARSSGASVPPDMVRAAQLRRRTMLKVLGHWLDDDPEIVAEIAAIRAGAGHQDLANDLEALADLYQRPAVRAVIAQDRKHYDKGDVKAARGYATGIFEHLGLGKESDAKRWGQLSLRAWTLLLDAYDEHRTVGIFLFRKLEDVQQTYPSLVSAARKAPSPSRRLTVEEGRDPLEGH